MAAPDYTNTFSAEIVVYDEPQHMSERVAVAAFLAGYGGGTRTSYTTDLRIFAGWCHDHHAAQSSALLHHRRTRRWSAIA